MPHVDAGEWRLVVEGEGLKRVELDLPQLQRSFKKHTITATVQCAGAPAPFPFIGQSAREGAAAPSQHRSAGWLLLCCLP